MTGTHLGDHQKVCMSRFDSLQMHWIDHNTTEIKLNTVQIDHNALQHKKFDAMKSHVDKTH